VAGLQAECRCGRTRNPVTNAEYLSKSAHKFKIGDTVFVKPARTLNVPGGAYVITATLPERDGDFEYRLRNTREPHERMMAESQLSPTP
jgi:hypothetical protein